MKYKILTVSILLSSILFLLVSNVRISPTGRIVTVQLISQAERSPPERPQAEKSPAGNSPQPTSPSPESVHNQGPPSSTSVLSQSVCNQIGGCFPSVGSAIGGTPDLGFNIYLNPTFTVQDQVVPDGGSICVGQPIQISSASLSGEWFSKGGPVDSPPVQIVSESQLQNIILNANRKRASVIIVRPPVIVNAKPLADSQFPTSLPADPEVAPGIILYKSTLYTERFNSYAYSYGSVICAIGGTVSSPSGTVSDNSYIPLAQGVIQLSVSYSPKCIFYNELFKGRNNYNQPAYDVLVLGFASPTTSSASSLQTASSFIDAFSLKPISADVGFNIVGQQSGAMLQTSTSSSGNTLVVTVTNNGETSAFLTGLQAQNGNPTSFSIKSKLPITIQPGSSADVIVSSSQASPDTSFTPSFTSSGVSCSSQPITTSSTTTSSSTTTTTSSQCSSNSDCTTNLCCEGLCRDPTQGACRDLLGNGVLKWIPFK